jgi:hypothetical protein
MRFDNFFGFAVLLLDCCHLNVSLNRFRFITGFNEAIKLRLEEKKMQKKELASPIGISQSRIFLVFYSLLNIKAEVAIAL